MRLRFRVRTLLVVVAVIALVLGARHLQRRHYRFRWLALVHQVEGQNWEMDIYAERWHQVPYAPPPFPPGPTHTELRIMYHDRLRRKYEYAAAHPWLSIEPNPPPPDKEPIFARSGAAKYGPDH